MEEESEPQQDKPEKKSRAKPTLFELECSSYLPPSAQVRKRLPKKQSTLRSAPEAVPEKWEANWLDKDWYESNFSSEQLAWEFLRRNRKFQMECDGLLFPDDDDELNGYKRRWGLARFKSYRSNFQPDRKIGGLVTKQSPEWAEASPSAVINNANGPLSRKSFHELKLLTGQVAVIYDFSSKLLDEQLLAKQVDSTKSILKATFSAFKKSQRTASKPLSDRRELMNYLRVADATMDPTKPSRAAIGRQFQADGLVLKNKSQTQLDLLQPYEFSKAIQPHLTAAYELIYEHGYLQILTSSS